MRSRRLVTLVLLLLVVVGLAAFSAKPLLTARGEFWTSKDIAGMSLEMQVAFNVKDRGDPEDDRGNISVRVFDKGSGKLIAVAVSSDVWDVQPFGAGILFMVYIRIASGAFPISGVFPIVAFDGAVDQMIVGGVWLNVERGNIVIR